MKHTKLLVAIITFFTLAFGSYILFKNHNAKKLEWYVLGKPFTKDLTQYITASGRLKTQDQITIGSLVAGRVVTLHADDNDFVKKGQVLVELDDGIGYSAVKKAQATLARDEASFVYVKAFYKRQEALFRSGQLAADTFELYTRDYFIAKAQVEKSKASLEIAQQTYDNLFIKTPDDGTVIAKKVDIGQMITSRFQATELFQIAKDLTKMEAEINVDESDIGLVKPGQEAIFTVDAFRQTPFHANVKQIHYDYKIIENVISYAVILDVDNPDLMLRPGMTTNVDIKVAHAPKALCVPNKALRINTTILQKLAQKEGMGIVPIPQTVETKAKDFVWVVEGNSFRQIQVELGVADGQFRQVVSGIMPNTIIVLEALDPERENPVLTMGKLRV